MIHKMQRAVLDTFTIFIAIFGVYIMACLYTYNQDYLKISLEKAQYIDRDQKIVEITDTNKEFIVKQGEGIELTFSVKYEAQINILVERVLIKNYKEHGHDIEKVYNISHLPERTVEQKSLYSKRIVPVVYNIPDNADTGCGYILFSRNYTKIPWNIISYILPKIVDSPNVKLCIEKK